MRLILLGLANLVLLVWTLVGLPFRLWRARHRSPFVRFKVAGDIPYRVALRPRRRWFGGAPHAGDGIESLETFEAQLDVLAEDPKVKGILLVVDALRLPGAKLQALKALLARFRSRGKRVVGWAVVAGNAEYDLLSSADQILFPKAGRIELTGFAAESMVVGKALGWLGIAPQFVRHGEYKTAPELFTRSEVSDAQQETVGKLLDERYATLRSDVAQGRGISDAEAAQKIDQGPYSARRGLAQGMCDGLVEELDLADHLSPGMGQTLGVGETGAPGFDAFATQRPWPPDLFLRRPRRKRLAVILLEGLITPGGGGGLPGLRGGTIGSDSLTQIVRGVARDKRSPAVLLYINSPGGSALASELMLEEIRRLALKKPVVVYVDRVAASGGYMAAVGAHEIWSDPQAIIGSIGVYAGKFDFSGLLEKVGIRRTVMTRGDQAGRFSFSRPFTPAERASLEGDVLETYKVFLEEVARSRKMTVEAVQAQAEGRVFSGRRAHEVGLVDTLGSFEAAARRAMTLAHVPSGDFDLWVPKPKRSRFAVSQLLQDAEQAGLFALWEPGWRMAL